METATLEGPVADAERSVLAAMLLGDEAIVRAQPLLKASAFHRTAHGRIFDAIVGLHRRGEKADLVTVAEELRERCDLEAVGGPSAIAQILECATCSANVEAHAAIVREAAAKRSLESLGRDLQGRRDPRSCSDTISSGLRWPWSRRHTAAGERDASRRRR